MLCSWKSTSRLTAGAGKHARRLFNTPVVAAHRVAELSRDCRRADMEMPSVSTARADKNRWGRHGEPAKIAEGEFAKRSNSELLRLLRSRVGGAYPSRRDGEAPRPEHRALPSLRGALATKQSSLRFWLCVTVPDLRSGTRGAASRPGHEVISVLFREPASNGWDRVPDAMHHAG